MKDFISQQVYLVCKTGFEVERPEPCDAVDLVLVLDHSGSVNKPDNNPNPIDQIKDFGKSLVREFGVGDSMYNSRAGTIYFTGFKPIPPERAQIKNYLTDDLEIVNNSINEGYTTIDWKGEKGERFGGTCIACGLQKAVEVFEQNLSERKKIAVLLTDGVQTAGINPDDWLDGKQEIVPEQIYEQAEILTDLGVELITIGIGSEVNTEILGISGNNGITESENAFEVNSFAELEGKIENMMEAMCGEDSGSGSDDEVSPSPPPPPDDDTPPDEKPPTWTFIYYMNGQSGLQFSLDRNFMNIMNKNFIEENRDDFVFLNMLVLASDGSQMKELKWKKEKINSDELEFEENITGQVDMGNYINLKNLVSYAKAEMPADNYYLVVFDHGAGYQGLSWGSGNYGKISVKQLAEAMGGGVDVVNLNACLMGNMETLYEIRNKANYAIANESLASGGNITVSLPLLIKQINKSNSISNPDIIGPKELAFLQGQAQQSVWNSGGDQGIEGGVYDLGKMESLGRSTSRLAEKIISYIDSFDYNNTDITEFEWDFPSSISSQNGQFSTNDCNRYFYQKEWQCIKELKLRDRYMKDMICGHVGNKCPAGSNKYAFKKTIGGENINIYTDPVIARMMSQEYGLEEFTDLATFAANIKDNPAFTREAEAVIAGVTDTVLLSPTPGDWLGFYNNYLNDYRSSKGISIVIPNYSPSLGSEYFSTNLSFKDDTLWNELLEKFGEHRQKITEILSGTAEQYYQEPLEIYQAEMDETGEQIGGRINTDNIKDGVYDFYEYGEEMAEFGKMIDETKLEYDPKVPDWPPVLGENNEPIYLPNSKAEARYEAIKEIKKKELEKEIAKDKEIVKKDFDIDKFVKTALISFAVLMTVYICIYLVIKRKRK